MLSGFTSLGSVGSTSSSRPFSTNWSIREVLYLGCLGVLLTLPQSTPSHLLQAAGHQWPPKPFSWRGQQKGCPSSFSSSEGYLQKLDGENPSERGLRQVVEPGGTEVCLMDHWGIPGKCDGDSLGGMTEWLRAESEAGEGVWGRAGVEDFYPPSCWPLGQRLVWVWS